MEYAPSNRKRLPYGMMNFADIRFDNYYVLRCCNIGRIVPFVVSKSNGRSIASYVVGYSETTDCKSFYRNYP